MWAETRVTLPTPMPEGPILQSEIVVVSTKYFSFFTIIALALHHRYVVQRDSQNTSQCHQMIEACLPSFSQAYCNIGRIVPPLLFLFWMLPYRKLSEDYIHVGERICRISRAGERATKYMLPRRGHT